MLFLEGEDFLREDFPFSSRRKKARTIKEKGKSFLFYGFGRLLRNSESRRGL
jgi:hypothetical protein